MSFEPKPVTIAVKHTIQMGHRLHMLPGQCQKLHGHTWEITLSITGIPDHHGILIDYHHVKKEWRGYLDENYDHRLCLDINDPLLNSPLAKGRERAYDYNAIYPGLVTVTFPPSTENLVQHWAAVAHALFGSHYTYKVEVWEGDKNYASFASE